MGVFVPSCGFLPVLIYEQLSAAFGYDFFIVPVQNSQVADFSAAPTVDDSTPVDAAHSVAYSAGVFTVNSSAFTMDGSDDAVRLSGLTAASLETDTGTEDIYTYDDSTSGFNQAVATTKSFSISLSGIADFGDAGYKILRLTEQNAVADACVLHSSVLALLAPLRLSLVTAP